MATDRPDPGEFLEMAQRMLRELFGGPGGSGGPPDSAGEGDPWGEATRSFSRERHREPSAEQQRQNLTFALATRAVEALEDLALNVAAIRQRLERTTSGVRTEAAAPPHAPDATAPEPPIDPGPAA